MYDQLYYLLAALDVALFSLLAVQIFRRRGGPVIAASVTEAFALLGAEIKRAVPDIHPGFTWEEAVAQLRSMRLRVDWFKVDRAVQSYEEYRYGGAEEPRVGYEEIHELVRELKRTV